MEGKVRGGYYRGLTRTRNGSESSVPAAYSAKSKAAPVLFLNAGEGGAERRGAGCGTLVV